MKIMAATTLMIVCATALSGLMSFLAWKHDSQGEITENGVIDYGYLAAIFGGWWVLSIGALAPLLLIWILLSKRKLRRMSETK
jgi:hypothetical protein